MRPSPQSSLRERGEGGARAARGLVERVVGERYRGDFPFRTNPAIGPLARADGQRQRARPGIDTRSRRRCARPAIDARSRRRCAKPDRGNVQPAISKQHLGRGRSAARRDSECAQYSVGNPVYCGRLEYHQPRGRPADLSTSLSTGPSEITEQSLFSGSHFGLGDINQTFYFSPAKAAELIWGVGPSFNLPTATATPLGSAKFSMGPSAIALTTPKPWVIGTLARQLWRGRSAARRHGERAQYDAFNAAFGNLLQINDLPANPTQ